MDSYHRAFFFLASTTYRPIEFDPCGQCSERCDSNGGQFDEHPVTQTTLGERSRQRLEWPKKGCNVDVTRCKTPEIPWSAAWPTKPIRQREGPVISEL